MTEAITSALSSVNTLFSAAVTMITDNGIAMIFIAMSLVGAAIGLFRKVRKA